MQINLKIKNISVKRLVSNDSSYQVLLEGIEGAEYIEEMAELIKLQQDGKYVKLVTDDNPDTTTE